MRNIIIDLAQAVVDTGAVPLLVLCIQEPEIALKRIAASALSDISKHSPEVCELGSLQCCVYHSMGNIKGLYRLYEKRAMVKS